MKYLFTLVIAVLLIGCKRGSTEISRTIQNSSQDTLHFELLYSNSQGTASLVLFPGDIYNLRELPQYSGEPENESIYPAQDIEELIIIGSNNDTLKRDYKCGCEWLTNITRKRNKGYDYKHTYLFEIVDKDFD
ncbi:MAG: hypothetical protein RL204_1696 [Bacteroidota bacterium]|jgi:hypothetical protein